MAYGKVHRFLLRTVASRGVLTVADAQHVLLKFTGDNEDISVADMVKDINDQIRPYQQEIKLTTNEFTNEQVIVFLSLGFDDASKSQNFFSATELEYFRVLIEQIMTTESRQITGINAINLVGKMKSTLNKTDAQKLLDTWCRMYYLEKEENNYALGVRAIHEFEGYLRQNMPDTIEECCLCKRIVFRGYNCPACSLAIHTRCLTLYLKKIQKWPCCKIDFSQRQLEILNSESSRLTQTQQSRTSQVYEENSTVFEPSQTQEATEEEEMSQDVDMTQESEPDISQRMARKRKRPN